MIYGMNTMLAGALLTVALVLMVLLLAGMHSMLRHTADMDDRMARQLRRDLERHDNGGISPSNSFAPFLGHRSPRK